MSNQKPISNEGIELYSDEIHNIFNHSSIQLQLYSLLCSVTVLVSLIFLLLTVKVTIKHELRENGSVVLKDREITLFELFKRENLLLNQMS